jgi:multiple antibiotic resistance protein
MRDAPEAGVLIGLGAVFTLLFITLGPLKIVGPFVQLTRDADEATMRRIAVRVMVLNLPTMLYARRMMGGATAMVLQIVGAVLGVLQVALAIEMVLRAMRQLGVLNG